MRRTVKNLSAALGAATLLAASALRPARGDDTAPAVAAGGEIPEITLRVEAAADVLVAPPNLVQQLTQQLRPLLKAEQQFLVSVCRPTPKQVEQLTRDGDAAVAAAGAQVAEWQAKQNQPQPFGQVKTPEPVKLIRDALAASAKKHLSPDQSSRYLREVKARDDDLRRVAVHNLVAKIDRVLFLSHEQRDKLVQSLTEHWDDKWGVSAQEFTDNDTYFPPIPDASINPILGRSQRKVWMGEVKVTRSNMGGFLNGNLGGQMQMEVQVEAADEEADLVYPPADVPPGSR